MRDYTVEFTEIDRLILESYKTLLDGLGDYLGYGYELVLHSLENLDSSVIKIINGYHTGRKEGAPITDLALCMLNKLERNRGKDFKHAKC
jgi:predicted transcriptional regulator YheO